MGISPFHSSSTFDNKCQKVNDPLPNPNPSNYKIISYYEEKPFLLVKINYPDCTNYEGNKILLFIETTISDLCKQKIIDPHFSNNKNFKSPIARFEPTSFGWIAAKRLIKALI